MSSPQQSNVWLSAQEKRKESKKKPHRKACKILEEVRYIKTVNTEIPPSRNPEKEAEFQKGLEDRKRKRKAALNDIPKYDSVKAAVAKQTFLDQVKKNQQNKTDKCLPPAPAKKVKHSTPNHSNTCCSFNTNKIIPRRLFSNPSVGKVVSISTQTECSISFSDKSIQTTSKDKHVKKVDTTLDLFNETTLDLFNETTLENLNCNACGVSCSLLDCRCFTKCPICCIDEWWKCNCTL